MSPRFAAFLCAFTVCAFARTSLLAESAAAVASSRFLIQEFQVRGVHSVQPEEIEETVYPFLGPERVAADVESARVAIESLYRSKGYQAASVQVPAQDAAGGLIVINVTEGVIGRTRVRGSQYSSIEQIKKDAPSLAEGQPLNFNRVARDLARLNQVADRTVTPSLKSGVTPDTIDVDLEVKEAKPPLSANVELNNRNSANTTDLRLNGGLSYGNLWQRGHTLGFSYQVAPERTDDSKVVSAYYFFHPAENEKVTWQFTATKQDSDVSTLGGSAVAGRGETLGARVQFTLTGSDAFYHSLSAGIDYKHLVQDLTAGGAVTKAPITYFPFSATYAATWLGKSGTTELKLTPTLGVRGLGSDDAAFDTRRSGATGSFISLRGELARTQKLFGGLNLYLRGQAQAASQQLVDSEQFSVGGLDSVRGYYESEVAGDDAVAGTIELRSPSLLPLIGAPAWGEWRVHAFLDGGLAKLQQPLPGQTSQFELASLGVGTRLLLRDHFTGSIDAGWPLLNEGQTKAGDLRVNFSIGAQY